MEENPIKKVRTEYCITEKFYMKKMANRSKDNKQNKNIEMKKRRNIEK